MKQWLWFVCLLSLSGGLRAERLDDSSSPRQLVEAPVVLANTGGLLADSIGATRATIKFGRVDYRLATAAYVGKNARIYYVIPDVITGLQHPSALTVSWRGEENIVSGTAHVGDRVLVWSGTVEDVWMNVGLDLIHELDLTALHLSTGEQFGFEAWFEIEVLP